MLPKQMEMDAIIKKLYTDPALNEDGGKRNLFLILGDHGMNNARYTF
jgi:hypothetical protein